MLLSDRDIKAFLDSGEIKIDPLDRASIQPSSLDLVLGNQFRILDKQRLAVIDATNPEKDITNLVEIQSDGRFLFHPGEFVLGTTVEKITLGNQVAAQLEGKSSLGRLGLMIHSTAGFIDPGFSGQITLELSNVSRIPIVLKPGMKIGHLAFLKLSSPCLRPYGSKGLGSKYQGQIGPTESRPSVSELR